MDLLASKPSSTPFNPSLNFYVSEGAPLSGLSSYRSLIGRLIYLTNSRPNTPYIVHHLSQFISQPLLPHYNNVIRLLRYMKVSPSTGIFSQQTTHSNYMLLLIQTEPDVLILGNLLPTFMSCLAPH